MPRLPRIYLKDALYFITCRAEHNENIYKDEGDYMMFLELLKRYQEQYGIKIFSFCLIPDHFHLLIELEKELSKDAQTQNTSQEISDFMRDLNNNYTKYFNGKYERKGHLFRERYKAAFIEKNPYLLKMTAYIHLNPEKLNLTQDAKEYPYSSYQYYLYNDLAQQKGMGFMKAAVDEALHLLGNANYAEFVRGVSTEDGEYIHKKLQRGGILGSEEFVKRVRAEVEAYQAAGEGQKVEFHTGTHYRLYFVFGSIFIILLAGLGGVYFVSVRAKINNTQKVPLVSAQTDRIGELRSSEWQIKMVSGASKEEQADTITFVEGKFVSAKMNELGYPSSNYSITVEDDNKIIWETMQTASDGSVVSWRGEIEAGKMSGVVSLRQKDKEPQDFSFMSLKHRRR
ncbi:MAG TPA: transposase [Candidatus Omnitrophota bacterium]|nr:transposase [Candidatus Omnitrophota bacterium]HQQ06578.1 transposase [Candidatus Omnitrophota bacterium]